MKNIKQTVYKWINNKTFAMIIRLIIVIVLIITFNTIMLKDIHSYEYMDDSFFLEIANVIMQYSWIVLLLSTALVIFSITYINRAYKAP